MPNKEKQKNRILIMSTLITILLLIYITQAWLFPTISRYIIREQDEIRAHYTSLYFSTTGEGKTVALENGVGYVDFDLRNYIGEKVTQRDIEYTVSKPSVFYDASGNEIPQANIPTYLSTEGNDLHVLDVWGKPQKVADGTYLYSIDVVANTGEVVMEGKYKFTYEQLGAGAKGKEHSLTCRLTRDVEGEPLDEKISLVVQLSKPYKEVYIINMSVSSRLITFSNKEINLYGVQFDKLYIQTADIFAYKKNATNDPRTATISADEYYKYTSYAFKLTITWSGYMLDEDRLEDIHIGTSSVPGGEKDHDAIDPDGIINNTGGVPNPEFDKPYIDVKKSTIAKINSIYSDQNGHTGELVIFVPQSSEIFLQFLKTANSGTVDVKVETYVTLVANDIELTSGYVIYSQSVFGGYEHTNNKFNLMNYTK